MPARITLDDLAREPLFVAWADRDGKKVPYIGAGRPYENKPATALTRAAAAKIPGMDGVGIILGQSVEIGGERFVLLGLDRDTFRDAGSGKVEDWAMESAHTFQSRREWSPSGTGDKEFFLVAQSEATTIASAMGGKQSQKFDQGGGKHPPGLQLFRGGYFTLTGKHVAGTSKTLRVVPAAEITRFLRTTGPAFAAQGGDAAPGTKPHDGTNSGRAWHAALHVHRNGTFEDDADDLRAEWRRRLDDDPDLTTWAEEQGERIWRTYCRAGLLVGAEQTLKAGGGKKRFEKRARDDADLLCEDWTEADQRKEIGEAWNKATAKAAQRSDVTSGPLKTWTPAECEAADPPDFVVQNLVARGDLGCVFGQPGAGKSVAAPHLAYAIAQGRKAFGLHTEQGPVLYVTGEDEEGAKLRVKAQREMHGDAPGFTLVSVSDLNGDQFDDLAALVEQQRPVAVFIDTLSACFPGLEENKAESVGAVVARMRRIAALPSHPAVIFIHHTPWAEARMRGHSSLFGTLESAVLVEAGNDGSTVSTTKVVKNKRGRGGRKFDFEVEVVEMGRDKWGGPITTVRAIERGVPAPTTKAGDETEALSVLRKLIESQGTPEIEKSLWRAECKAEWAGRSADAFRAAWARVTKALSAKRLVTIDGKSVTTTTDDSTVDFHPEDADDDDIV